jgi:hypothetical protein
MTKVAKKTQPISKAVVKSAELVVKDKEISYDQIWQFVQENAGGNEANVKIIPLPSVDLKSKTPLPFGYNGKPGGVRETIQNWMLHGISGDHSLKTILGRATKLGHSKKKPVCLHALMHGGYSPSSKYWLTPYIKLVVQA